MECQLALKKESFQLAGESGCGESEMRSSLSQFIWPSLSVNLFLIETSEEEEERPAREIYWNCPTLILLHCLLIIRELFLYPASLHSLL